MHPTYLTIIKVILIPVIFFIIVRFLFSTSREEQESRISPEQIKEEIKDISKGRKDISIKEKGEILDSLMEEYYSSEKSDKL